MTYEDCKVFLRVASKVAEKNGSSLTRTYLHVLKAHLHGRIHMKTYRGLSAGWRYFPIHQKEILFPSDRSLSKWLKCYRSKANVFYLWSCINSLQDQADWILQTRKKVNLFPDVTDFVLENSRACKKT